MEQQLIVELRQLSKTIGKKKIIDNLDLSLYPGQFTGFLGPNGAGKTTTSRMIAGLKRRIRSWSGTQSRRRSNSI
jgi:ABC-2 type transport system ATP-binding protein